ncbi:flagellar basal body P-ring formation chaperone FlgA [Helicobacter pylori]|uniref:flagellar basal body P-ring formation chaperone FlgA n=1 Tax=Helicobacter pylori TaxID=210 RepID=UPI00073D4969|nr:flagellar basal body P-ring formation chaperone FlgA [Helicobacter pylori]OKA02000.1 flagella basal body P-ring formation protein FlgA [Helicobacter pylori]OKA02393.1 flagella basal body P-ring formation protein FlgA [Helicobacter pylori]OMQ18718.1 flagella basal body P-ring formation protein FlgA [Helicobacter pylori]OMQ19849.1 flagella basal body P-ring formation protein FlgA [Helicobacter pylori]
MKILILFLFCLNMLFALDSNALKAGIKEAYLKEYKDLKLEIETIHLEIPERFSNASILSYELNASNKLKKDGVVFLRLENEPNLRLPVRYSVIASMQAFKSVSAIKKDENITANNTQKERVLFGALSNPLLEGAIGKVSAKNFIPPNTLLSADKTQALIIVRKNDIITGVYEEGQISIEISLKALENGAINQIIQAKNVESNKILKAKVLSSSKAQIL